MWQKGVLTFMKIDLQKLDDRIRKLQEVRRIAANPELATILLEFLSTEDGGSEPIVIPRVDESAAPPRPDEAQELVKELVGGMDSQPRGGLWTKRR